MIEKLRLSLCDSKSIHGVSYVTGNIKKIHSCAAFFNYTGWFGLKFNTIAQVFAITADLTESKLK